MKFEYEKYNANYCAIGLRFDESTETLHWDMPPGRDTLVVQIDYGSGLSDRADELCDALTQEIPEFESLSVFREISNGMRAKWVSAVERAKNSEGCKANGLACAYAVFALGPSAETVAVYGPESGAIDSGDSFLRVPQHVQVGKSRVVKESGRFIKRTEESGFTRVSFPQSLQSGYVDGDLSLEIDGLPRPVPVTRQMIGNGSVYVKAEPDAIAVLSNKAGLLLE